MSYGASDGRNVEMIWIFTSMDPNVTDVFEHKVCWAIIS